MSTDNDFDLAEIKRVLTNPKTPYRLWTNPDPQLTGREQKQSAEFEVTTEFCEAIEAIENKKVFKRKIGICENDPPDAIVQKLDGSKIGVELTELLDEEIQKERVKQWRNHRRWGERKIWESEELISVIQKRIGEKTALNKPEFRNGPFSSRVLVIYSVETTISVYFRDLAAAICETEFSSSSRFDEIYFLTVSAPMQNHPQLCKLRLKSLNEN